ncbi:hypothetical protein QAD02_010336 [Eretmocerus hayati]|uniref:Uncharacterized protein n=1 Tax=Eretmocerus hayati TaxID=131215 RepID=A0ACC2ND23_9HYME|nr:hypothetical protein QAD02_010336 [Eretmocerus hayati]
MKANQLKVLAGSSELKSCKKYPVESWTAFKTWANANRQPYSTNELDNNIAILTLSEDVAMKKATVCTKKAEELFSRDAQMVGWASPASVFLKVPLKLSPVVVSTSATILTREGCEDIAGALKNAVIHVHEEELCVISDRSVELSFTDAGVPLVSKKMKILGVLSGVCPDMNCENKIFVFTSIEPYRKFIEDITGRDGTPWFSCLSPRKTDMHRRNAHSYL